MEGDGDRAGAPGGLEDPGAVTAGGVDDQLSGPPGVQVGQTRDEGGQGVVGHGEYDELGPTDDLLDVEHGDCGQKHFGAFAGGLGDGVYADDPVVDGTQSAAQDGADASGRDDADVEPTGDARSARCGWGAQSYRRSSHTAGRDRSGGGAAVGHG